MLLRVLGRQLIHRVGQARGSGDLQFDGILLRVRSARCSAAARENEEGEARKEDDDFFHEKIPFIDKNSLLLSIT